MLSQHPEVVLILIFLFITGLRALYLWATHRRPHRMPNETIHDRIYFRVTRWPEWAAAWGYALCNVIKWADLVIHVRRTEREFDEMAYRFGCVLSEATGGLMSKTNYDLPTMYTHIHEVWDREVNDRLIDALADLTGAHWNKTMTRAINELIEVLEVNADDVRERQRQKSAMAKILKRAHKSRQDAKQLASLFGVDAKTCQAALDKADKFINEIYFRGAP
jgi:hypothetical protein